MANEIEEIKSRLDLVELVGSYVTLKKAGANYKAVCPFHQEKTASLMVSPEKQIWKCFGCGRGGDHYKFVMEAEALEFGDALKLLAQKAGVTLQSRTRAEYQTRDRKERLYALNDFTARIWQEILVQAKAGEAALRYLKGRGLKAETIKQHRLGYAPASFDLKAQLLKRGFLTAEIARAGAPEKFFERIIFPMFDVLGNVAGFTGRTLTDKEPKYLNSPETPVFNKSRVLYGLHTAKAAIKERNFTVLVEGQMDVLMLHQAGITQAVASSGTAITETQLQILSKYTPNFLLAFDNDEAGIATTKKVIELLLSQELNSKVLQFGQYKDASELIAKDPKAWKTAATAAKEGVEWWLELEMISTGKLQFIENKKKVIRAMLPVLALVKDEARLDHYTQRLALALGVKIESIYAAVSRARPTASVSPATVSSQQLPLTNEEQLLALVLVRPKLLAQQFRAFKEIAWQSEAASSVAELIGKHYNNETLAKAPATFLSTQLKTQLDPTTAGKLDSWQLWLTSQWQELSDELAAELFAEKIGQLTTKNYELKKSALARQIKQAQEAGDISKVKSLMKGLNTLTREAR